MEGEHGGLGLLGRCFLNGVREIRERERERKEEEEKEKEKEREGESS